MELVVPAIGPDVCAEISERAAHKYNDKEKAAYRCIRRSAWTYLKFFHIFISVTPPSRRRFMRPLMRAKRFIYIWDTPKIMTPFTVAGKVTKSVCVCVCMQVRVCVCERRRKRVR